jgi:hypothetical protein
VSEKSIARQRAGRVRRAKTNWRKTTIMVGFVLLANSLCPRQERRTMLKLEIQIDRLTLVLGTFRQR